MDLRETFLINECVFQYSECIEHSSHWDTEFQHCEMMIAVLDIGHATRGATAANVRTLLRANGTPKAGD